MQPLLALSLLATAFAHPDLIPRATSCQPNETPGKAGTCMATASCAGWSIAGYCPGGADNQCCVKTACSAPYTSGVCQNDYKPCGQAYVSDHCPGPADIRCCPAGGDGGGAHPGPTPPSICENPERDTCNFYPDCLESKYHCGSSGYPIGYGLKYCEAFTAAKPRLSARGNIWVSDTMLCLQRALVPFATYESTTCPELKGAAIATHPDCYVNSGVCVLPPTDWAVIVNTVDLKDLFGSLDQLKAVLKTVDDCADFYLWLIKRGVIKVLDDIGEAAKKIWDKITFWS